jgi:hypothetical protein
LCIQCGYLHPSSHHRSYKKNNFFKETLDAINNGKWCEAKNGLQTGGGAIHSEKAENHHQSEGKI